MKYTQMRTFRKMNKTGINGKNILDVKSIVESQAQMDYWKIGKTFSKVVSKYNSEQFENSKLVKCTCCDRRVPGISINWNVPERLVRLAKEDVPTWTPCEKCHKFLSHYEEDNVNKFLGMCIECFQEQGGRYH